jgi:hypothetical protein
MHKKQNDKESPSQAKNKKIIMRFSHKQIAKCVRIKGGLSIGILTLIIGTPKEPQMIKVCSFEWFV